MDHTKAIASAEMLAALRAAATNERALTDPCEDTLTRLRRGRACDAWRSSGRTSC